MMTLKERTEYLQDIFDELQDTSSRLEKEYIVDTMKPEMLDDFNACLEVLDGRYIFGFKIPEYLPTKKICLDDYDELFTVRDIFDMLMIPSKTHNLSQSNIEEHILRVIDYADFLIPIVNKTLRLGIGRSLLPEKMCAPMLANKFEEKRLLGKMYITEKLDGNRCISYWNGDKWIFKSRNGKLMYVNFDMSGMSKDYIYDGEVLSASQSAQSELRIQELSNDVIDVAAFKGLNQFNSTSGMINRHTLAEKDLVYHIFDIQSSDFYSDRREILNNQKPSGNVIIVPLLGVLSFDWSNKSKSIDLAMELLDKITSTGGEGLMFNADTRYEHKRTNGLLKLKQVKTMDMCVTNFELGKGKYENVVGTLYCAASNENAVYECKVGTGLSDEQRMDWAANPKKIIGKIVEVAYFEASQNKDITGTKMYSLRFPRLIKIRSDKTETSTI